MKHVIFWIKTVVSVSLIIISGAWGTLMLLWAASGLYPGSTSKLLAFAAASFAVTTAGLIGFYRTVKVAPA